MSALCPGGYYRLKPETARDVEADTMTTTTKVVLAGTMLLLLGAVLYEVRLSARTQQQILLLQQEEPLTNQIEPLRQERDQAAAEFATASREVEELRRKRPELLRLRGEASLLRLQAQVLTQQVSLGARLTAATNDAATEEVLKSLGERVDLLKQKLDGLPAYQIPELGLADEDDWIKVAKGLKTEAEPDLLKGLARLRTLAKEKFIVNLQKALKDFTDANNGDLPTDLAQLGPYLQPNLDEAVLQRYKLVTSGNVSSLGPGAQVVREKARLTPDDSVWGCGLTGFGSNGPDE